MRRRIARDRSPSRLTLSVAATVILAVTGAIVPAAIGGADNTSGPTPAAASTASNSTLDPVTDWPQYLNDPSHTAFAAGNTAITQTNAGSLSQAWNFNPSAHGGSTFIASPTAVRGVVYIGSNNGTFYALNQSTGAVLWSQTIGQVTKTTCGTRGFASTATVASDPVTNRPTVYVAAPDGYLYAFDAATGSVDWRSVIGIPSTTQNDYFAWSSPVVANGLVYQAISSQCDLPLVRGGLMAVNAHTGAQVAEYFNVPANSVGGSIWSTPAVGPSGVVYVTTGNGPSTDQFLGTSESIVGLEGATLAAVGSWQIPHPSAQIDSDFGGSPTLFPAILPGQSTPSSLIGACNKNGVYYALNRANLAAGPVWKLQVGAPASPTTGNAECIAAAADNGQLLFVAGPETTINGTTYQGSIRGVNPATGQVVWATGLPGSVDGAPIANDAGLVAVGTFGFTGNPNAEYLLSASTGQIVATISTGNSPVAAPAVFSGNDLLISTWKNGLLDYRIEPKQPIQHVVVILQENHSFDNVLGDLCVGVGVGRIQRGGANQACDGAISGELDNGQTVRLSGAPDVVPSTDHSVAGQQAAINNGMMNGYNLLNGCTGTEYPNCYAQYYPMAGPCSSQTGSCIPNVSALASHFAISDRTFELYATPSWAGHLVFATATDDGFSGLIPTPPAAGSPQPVAVGPGWGCDSGYSTPWGPKRSLVPSCVPDSSGSLGPNWAGYTGPKAPYVPTIFDELQKTGHSWKIYGGLGIPTTNQGFGGNGWAFAICPSFAECLYSSQRQNLVPATNIVGDAATSSLPSFSIVTPTVADSQHNDDQMSSGDNWIGQVMSALESSPEWSSTAVFITWDDCGCFYDHVNPLQFNSQWGIRVPMIIASPWVKPGSTDSGPTTFAGILAFAEHTFGLNPLNTNDGTAYDFSNSFCFATSSSCQQAGVIPVPMVTTTPKPLSPLQQSAQAATATDDT